MHGKAATAVPTVNDDMGWRIRLGRRKGRSDLRWWSSDPGRLARIWPEQADGEAERQMNDGGACCYLRERKRELAR